MNYEEYIPSTELSKFIDKFWIASEFENGFSQRVLPEACTNFVFHLNENEGTSNILGANTKFGQFSPSTKDYYFGVNFNPGILGVISNEDFSGLKDSFIPTNDLFPTFNHLFLEQLNERKIDYEKLKFVDNELKKLLLNKPIKTRFLSTSVADLIKKNHKITTNDISEEYHISIRHLQRKFKSEVGVSMKTFSRIIRFNKAIKRIQKNKNESLLSISFDLGFYDHSHLTNEIKYFAGIQPSELR